MINLLPQEERRQLKAARSNTLLLRYNFLLLAVGVFLAASVGVTYFYLNSTRASAEAAIQDNANKTSGYAASEEKARTFRSNLTTAKQILDREVAYTKVILEISQVLPQGIILENLNLDSQTFGTETVLVAKAKDYSRALALKDSFEQSSLFSNVHFKTITAGDASGGDYPVSAELAVTINKEVAK